MADMTEKFVTALSELHKNREVGPLVELFADDATLNKAGIPHGEEGKDGARTFWEQYREVFDEIGAFRTHYDTAAFLNADKRNA
jgi:hypothetical protein